MKRDTKWTPAISGLACLLGLALGGVFFYAGLQKRLEPYQFAEAILAYDLVPLSLVGLVAAVLPWVELTSGFFLTLGYLLEITGRLLVWLGFSWGKCTTYSLDWRLRTSKSLTSLLWCWAGLSREIK